MKLRTMHRDDWKCILQKTIHIEEYDHAGSRGKLGILRMDRVEPLFRVPGPKGPKIIAAPGYCWVQLAPEGGFCWLTAMFDENGAFQEIYFDITDGNRTELPDPAFRDMYLDYVLYPDHLEELDKNELLEAFEQGEITEEEYARTLREGERLKTFLEAHGEEVIRALSAAYTRLSALLPQKEATK